MDAEYKRLQVTILSGNVDQLKQILASSKSGNNLHFVPHLALSQVYAELKHRNIPISDEIVHFIEYELVRVSYGNAYQDNVYSGSSKIADPADRVAHMVECIELVVANHTPCTYTAIDELMVLRLRQIYADVFFLKTHLRKLPLLQLQFCIAVFLKLVTGEPVNGFDVYAFAIDKERLVRFLKLIRHELIHDTGPIISLEGYFQTIQCLINSTGKAKRTDRVPKRIRTYIRTNLPKMEHVRLADVMDVPFESIPPTLQQHLRSLYEKTIDWDYRKRSRRVFKELYDTYYIMKQHYSIRKVLTYIDGIREGPRNDPPHMLPTVPSPTRIRAIKRTLQVIGEMIKSTRESPNITVKLNRVLQLITSEALTERTKDLRQFFSHGYSLAKWALEEENVQQLGTVFQKIETNLREARRWFVYTQTQQNLLIYRRYLVHLKRFRSIDALRNYITFVGTEFKAALIESFVPEQLTEAKLLIQYMLDTASPPESLESTVRNDLEYIVKELQCRIDAIRAENGSLGRTVDEFFFLETYIRQPTASLAHVQQIVEWVLRHTELSNRHKLVQKTDLMYARDLLTHLQFAETDDDRRYIWGNIWMRLAKERFGGLDTLLVRTEQRSDVALDATVETMRALNLPLHDDEYVQFVNRRLAKSYYSNVYVLDNKYRILKEIVKDRRAQVNVRTVLEHLKDLRKEDECMLQHMFDGLLDSMAEILNRCEQSTGTLASLSDQLALEYCLLEVTEILCNLSLFRDNVGNLVTPNPFVTGRNLRNYLAHDFLAYDTLSYCTNMVVLNARYLIENRTKLYSSMTAKLTPSKGQPDNGGAIKTFRDIFQRQTDWTTEQMEFFDLVANFRTHELEQRIHAAEREGYDANLLLMQRSLLDKDVISIALNRNPAAFIAQLLEYDATNSNFFHLLLQHYKVDDLVEKIRILIESPHAFCCRLAIKYGLLEMFHAVRNGCGDSIIQNVIRAEVSTIFLRHSTEFICELMNVLPSEWFLQLVDHLGNTVLHWAVLKGDKQLLLFVLRRYKMLLKAKNKFGDVPLLIAVRYHEDALVDILLEHGADPWIDPKIIHMITMRGNTVLLDRLRDDKGCVVAQQMRSRITHPLRAAIEGNNYEMFVMLHRTYKYKLEHGELLHLAALLNRMNLLRYILTEEKDNAQHEMYIDSVSKDYAFTPLMLACATGHFEAAQLLLENGANGLFQNKNEYTPWHCAVYGRNRSILSLLLSIPGLDVNSSTRDKRSALSIAIEGDHTVDQIVFLLSVGVIIQAEHIFHACILAKKDILKVLIDRNPEYISSKDFLDRSPLMIAAALKDESMVRYLLDRGADRDVVNVLGMNLLHVAALNNLIPICRMLLDAHVDYEAQDNFRRTPLVVALENEHLTIVEQLLQSGASLESAYKYRFEKHRNATLLHKFTVEKRPRMVEYLVKKLKFPIHIEDDDGKTAAMYEDES